MNRENDHRIHDPPVEERVVGRFTTEYGTDELQNYSNTSFSEGHNTWHRSFFDALNRPASEKGLWK